MTILFPRAAPWLPFPATVREAAFVAIALPIVVTGFAAAIGGVAVLYVAGMALQAIGEATGVWKADR